MQIKNALFNQSKWLMLGLCAAFWTSSSAAENGDVTSFTLDNGLQLVVIEDNRAAAVVHMVWYPVGSADEPRGQSGVAHYLEHLMFEGTDDLERGEFSAIVSAQGGTDNAFTSYDYTAYFQRVAADRLGLMMSLEAERMQDLVIDPIAAATEHQVIIEERNQRTDNNPSNLFFEELRSLLWRHHPYGTPIIGWRHEMDELGVDEARAWYDAHYAPDRAIVVVAGDMTPEEALRGAEAHYGSIPPSGAPIPVRAKEPPQRGARRLVMEDERVGQPFLVRLYHAPSRGSGDASDAAALTVLAELLGASQTTSVLAQELQFDRNVAVWTSAGYSGLWRDATSFSLTVVPADGVSLSETEDALDSALRTLISGEIDPAQLERIKRQLRADQIFELDNARARADRYGRALSAGLSIEEVEAWPQLLQEATAEDIQRVAADVLDIDRSVTGWLRAPQSEEN